MMSILKILETHGCLRLRNLDLGRIQGCRLFSTRGKSRFIAVVQIASWLGLFGC